MSTGQSDSRTPRYRPALANQREEQQRWLEGALRRRGNAKFRF
jgi:hypothetical protein